uniref:Leucine-rich repeat family protein n=1 Tax=Tetraselmis sp. GSL018 TaxID=582737 RepID=A0A061S5D8_9CHLO|mmetsp:Transcript_10828/g.25735  ORF Transcript_10828/g.25735 Transcript_10828/m.25735 type:complete len:278 (+) Transcript_10828:331-1164(+)
MGNFCCPERRPTSAEGDNKLNREKTQRLANYAATGIVPLRDARLQDFPIFVKELGDKIKTLDVTNNRLTEVPPSIEANYNITRLILAKNAIMTLPPQIGALSNLKILTLDSNRLTGLPRAICGLEKLEVLSVNANELNSLPEEIGQLRRLKVLSISHNKLIELPSSTGRCSSLEELTATHNHLRALPTELGDLERLKVCNFDSNRIEAVPSSMLLCCVALQTLSLHDNPITADSLASTQGYDDFEQRRRNKFDKQISAGVLLGPGGLDEGIDRKTVK